MTAESIYKKLGVQTRQVENSEFNRTAKNGFMESRIITRALFLAAIIMSCLIYPFAWVNAAELSQAEKAYLKDKGIIVFVSQTHYPPFEFVGSDGDHTGMCIELARWIATEFGFKAQFIDTSFKQAQDAVLSGKADLLTSLFFSKNRDELFDFTKAMFDVPASIFVPAERPDIKDLKDLQGKTVAMQAGDYAKEFLEENNISCSFNYTKNFAEATDLVIAGKADALIGDEEIVLYHIFSNNLTERIKKVGEPLYIGKNCMGAKDPNPLLMGIMNKGIDLAKKRGILDQIYKKWIGTKYLPRSSWIQRYYSYLLLLMGAILAVAVLGWLWNLKLRQMVHERTRELSKELDERKKAENALKKSEERFKFLAENMADIVWTLDMNFITTYVSPSVEKVLGFTPEERKKQRIEEMVTPDSMEKITALYLEELQRDTLKDVDPDRSLSIEVEYYHRNGSILWFENIIKALRDETGELIGIYGVSRDITRRKRAEEANIRSKEEWERTFNTVPDLIAILDENYQIVRANKSMADKLGLTVEEVVGKTCYEVVHGTDKPPSFCPYKRLLADGDEHEAEVAEEILGGDFFVTVSPIFDQAGKLIGSVHVARNVTERKRIEEALKRSEEKFRTMFDTAAVGLCLTSMQTGALLGANQKYCDIVGYSKEELRKLTFQDITYPDDLQEDIDKMKLLEEGKIDEYSLEKRYLRPDRSTVWVNLTVSSMGSIGDQSIHLAVIEDITERKRLEQIMLIQRDLGIALGLTDDLHEALAICLDAALNVEHIDCGGIYLVDDQDGSVHLATQRSLPDEFAKIASHFDANSPQARIIQKGETITQSYEKLLTEIGLESQEIDIQLKSGLRGLVVIPIVHEGNPVGALNFVSKSCDVIPKFAQYSLEAIASQIAGTLARISADHALKTSQRNLQTLFESLDDFLFILDTSGNIVDFNPVVEKRLGYPVEHLKGMSVLGVHPPDRRREAGEIVQKIMQGETDHCPVPLFTQDGNLIEVETKITKGTWNGRDAVFGVSRDITRRIAAEKARTISEDRLLAAIEAIDEGFVIYDSEDRLEMCNAKYLDIYKESTDLLVPGARFRDIIRKGVKRGQYADAVGREDAWIEERIAEHRAADGNLEQELCDGRWLKIAERRTKNGSIVGFRIDITEMKRSAEERERLIRELREALENIKRLRGLLPICSSCKKIRDDKGYWNQLERYITDHSEATFSHSICPECAKKLYPDFHVDDD